MKRSSCLLCVFTVLLALLVGCDTSASDQTITCEDVIVAYEDAGYEVWHREYLEQERDYVCEITAENSDDAIRFYFFDTTEKAEKHTQEHQWNVVLWAYSVVSGDPTWVHTETYHTIAVEYENKELYTPFKELK